MPLVVHFLNVGRGDCTIIEFPSGRIGVVDIDNLDAVDEDTRKEILEEYHHSIDYLSGRDLGRSRYDLDEEFIKKEIAKLTDPLAYYDTHIGKEKAIFRFLITHPDMDHMTGLHRIHEQDNRKSIVNFWHTGNHDFNLADVSDEDWEDSPYDKRDWETYRNYAKALIQSRVFKNMLVVREIFGLRMASRYGLQLLSLRRKQLGKTNPTF